MPDRRPAATRSDGAVDVSLRLTQAAVPQFDALTATRDPADLALDATLTAGRRCCAPERWRASWSAGGRPAAPWTSPALSLAKGDQRVQAKGNLALDSAHRPAGQIDLRAAGVDALVGSVVGQRFGSDRGALVGQLVGGLLGLGRRPDAETPVDGAPLKALPPLRLVDGRLVFSGFPIPNVHVPALY